MPKIEVKRESYNKKPVTCTHPNGKEFHYVSVVEAARECVLSAGCIYQAARGVYNGGHEYPIGYKWRYDKKGGE